MKITTKVQLKRSTKGQKKLAPAREEIEPGRIPRVAKLMALAIRFDQMIRDGLVRDQAELARLGRVTRARLTQIMNLLYLAPDIQERLLFLPRIEMGADSIGERFIRSMTSEPDWHCQRRRMRKAARLV